MNRESIHETVASGVRAKEVSPKAGRIRPDLTIASDRDGDNYIERRGSEIYFKKGDEGQWFHLYDVRISDGRIRRVAYESAKATHRVFVMPVGQWRYTFERGEIRYVTASALTRQRIGSRWHASKNQHAATP